MRYLNFYFNFRFATYHLVSKYSMACSCVLFYMHSLLDTIQYNPNITCYCQDMMYEDKVSTEGFGGFDVFCIQFWDLSSSVCHLLLSFTR